MDKNNENIKSTSQSPLISIITAVYNDVEYIKETIDSIIFQTYENIEYIVIDGASTDGTVDVIKKYENEIDYFVSENDNGIYHAINKGLKQAKGEIIGILNAGDLYHKNTIKSVVENYNRNPNEKCLFFGETVMINGKDVVGINTKIFRQERILRGFGFLHTSCFVPKKVYCEIGDFDESYEIAGDSDFLLRCFMNDVTFIKINILNYMRTGGVSETNLLTAHKEYMSQIRKYDLVKEKSIKKYEIIYRLAIPYFKLRRSFTLRKILIQINLLLIHTINCLHRIIPFHFFKKLFLKWVGYKIGDKTYLYNGLKLFSLKKLKIGNNTVINRDVYLDNRRGIEIGNNVSIAHNCKIYTLGHDIDSPFFETKGAPVTIKDNVVLFSSVMVMPGITIEEGGVALPGSTITKNVAKFQVVGGNPAKHIRYRNKQINYELNYGFWKAL